MSRHNSRKSVKSLKHLCVQSIASNLDKFESCADGRISVPSDKKDIAEDELSCFEASQLVVSIMDAALADCCTASKDKNLLALLITSHLDMLDLSHLKLIWTCPTCGEWATFDGQKVLHLLRTAALRHSPLKTLGFSLNYVEGFSLDDAVAVPCLVFKDLLPAFPNLKKLDVSYSSKESINDDFLALLAAHCLNLESLSLICCKGVTDVGIELLCGFQDAAIGSGVDQGCNSLLRLNVEGTQVTRRGARLALERLPKLQIFDWSSTLLIAAQMHRANGTRRPLNLKNLNGSSVTWPDDNKIPYVRGSLMHAALRLCPLVTHVNVSWIRNLDDADLPALLNLICLKKLTIGHCPEISFNEGLLPIIKKFGPSSLESLALMSVPEVNIGSIVEYCSELRKIRLNDIHRYSPSRPGLRQTSPRHHLPHLRRLMIMGYIPYFPLGQPSLSDMSLLLSSAPELERIGLHYLRGLNDGILEEAMTCHGFIHLHHVMIDRCPGITKGVVGRLFELDLAGALAGASFFYIA